MKNRVKNEVLCTGEGARTPTPLREMDFESIASTNSATPALFTSNDTLEIISQNNRESSPWNC